MREDNLDFQNKVAKLYKLTVYARWLFILICWLTVGIYGIWGLRAEIALWLDYFTWAAVYYGLHFNFIPTMCLVFCIAVTLSVMVWQSRNMLWGLPLKEKRQLEHQVRRIMATGKKHPLWKWINSK